jgi:hypothetical protein
MSHVSQIWTKQFQGVTTSSVCCTRHGCDMKRGTVEAVATAVGKGSASAASKRRGRQAGRGKRSSLLTERVAMQVLARMAATGERVNTAARSVLGKHGVEVNDLKGRVDHIARMLKQWSRGI